MVKETFVTMAPRKTRAEKQAETRERLLRAAERIAVQRGLSVVTLEAVARQAGLTKGAIYSNFESKDDLLFEVVNRLTPALTLNSLIEEVDDVPSLLARLASELARLSRTNAKDVIAAAEFDALVMRDPRLRRGVVEQETPDPEDDPSGQWLIGRQAELPLPVEQFVEVINALAQGLLIRRLVYGEERMPDELIAWALSRLAVRPGD
jgi:AcrR family transcriptional regulator